MDLKLETLSSNSSVRRDTEIIEIKNSQSSNIQPSNYNKNKNGNQSKKSRNYNRKGRTYMCCYSKNEFPRIVIGPDCKLVNKLFNIS